MGRASSPEMNRPALASGAPWVVLATLGGAGLLGAWTTGLGLSPSASTALTILLMAAFLWITELVPLFVTSFVILILNVTWLTPTLRDAGRPVDETMFLAPFFSNVILLFLGGFVLSSAFHKYLIDERIAVWVLERTGDRPARVLLGMMLATGVLSMWMSNTATTAMMLGLSGPLLAAVPEKDGFRPAVLLGIPFAANLGGLGTPIGTPPNAIALQYLQSLGTAPSFAGWILLSLPVLLLSFAFAWWLLLRLHRPTVARVRMPDDRPSFRWSTHARIVVIVTAVTVLGWLTTGVHPLNTGTVALLPVVVFFGFGVLEIPDFRQLSWDVLILAGGGMSLGAAVDVSGLGQWLVALIPAEGSGLSLVVVAFVVIGSLMTSVMSNTATANLLIPVVMGLSGLSISPVLIAVAFSCSVTMVLPVSTPPNAMAFGSGLLKSRDLISAGLAVSLVGLVLTATLGLWWWNIVGLY